VACAAGVIGAVVSAPAELAKTRAMTTGNLNGNGNGRDQGDAAAGRGSGGGGSNGLLALVRREVRDGGVRAT
jgi:hypothetical protein